MGSANERRRYYTQNDLCPVKLRHQIHEISHARLHWNYVTWVLNYRQLDCLLKCLFRLTAKEISELRVTDLSWEETIGGFRHRWISIPSPGGLPAQSARMRKAFPCHDVIMQCCRNSTINESMLESDLMHYKIYFSSISSLFTSSRPKRTVPISV